MEEFVDEQAEEVDSDMEDDDMPALTEDSDDNDDSDSDEDVLIFQKGPNEHEAQSKATGFGEVQESADVQIDAEEKSVPTTTTQRKELLRVMVSSFLISTIL